MCAFTVHFQNNGEGLSAVISKGVIEWFLLCVQPKTIFSLCRINRFIELNSKEGNKRK